MYIILELCCAILYKWKKGAEQIINLLLDEVLVNTMERCFEPIPFEENTIIEYCNSKLKKALGQPNPTSIATPTTSTKQPTTIQPPTFPQQTTPPITKQ